LQVLEMAERINAGIPIKLESWEICPLSDLKFCKLFSGFGKLTIIKLDNLVI
jgi:hypothetical protein